MVAGHIERALDRLSHFLVRDARAFGPALIRGTVIVCSSPAHGLTLLTPRAEPFDPRRDVAYDVFADVAGGVVLGREALASPGNE